MKVWGTEELPISWNSRGAFQLNPDIFREPAPGERILIGRANGNPETFATDDINSIEIENSARTIGGIDFVVAREHPQLRAVSHPESSRTCLASSRWKVKPFFARIGNENFSRTERIFWREIPSEKLLFFFFLATSQRPASRTSSYEIVLRSPINSRLLRFSSQIYLAVYEKWSYVEKYHRLSLNGVQLRWAMFHCW